MQESLFELSPEEGSQGMEVKKENRRQSEQRQQGKRGGYHVQRAASSPV